MIKSIKKISRKHYIQCGLAVLMTGLVLYFTSALWYSKAVMVSFNAEAKKDINYQVFYTEAKGQGMNEKQSVKKIIKSGNQKVKILLPIEEVVKIRLDIGSNPGDVVISDLKIKKCSKSIKLDYNEFNKNQIDKYEVKDDKLYITSNQGDPYLLYKQELNLPAGMQIDWCKLIIISILAFLLMYKFVQYLSRFKIEKQHSRIDIVMLAVFFALLFVPMSHISDAEKSEQENRMLAKKPQLTIDGDIDNNYGVQFDAWYNDHFFGRDAMMKLYQNIKYFITPMIGNDKVLVGKDGWLFYKRENGINNYANNVTLSEMRLKQGLDYLKAIDGWCKKNGKEFYYVIAPDKDKIYGENYRLIRKQRSDEYSIGNQFADYIKKNSDIKVIYLYNALMKNKNKGLLYYKHDTHWNDLGAYYGYRALMKLMKMPEKSYEFDKVSYDSHQHINMGYSGTGDLDRMLGNIFLKDTTLYNKLKIKNTSLCKSYNINARHNECNNPKEEKKLFMLRDSFGGALLYYLSDNFYKIHTETNSNSISYDNLKMIKDNYDIVVLENVERFIPIILNQKFPNLPKEN